jgi:hypothetical protein
MILVALMLLAGWSARAGLNLVLITLLMTLVMVALGLAIMQNPAGVLINQRNLMSLSRFQMVIWTVVVMAAYFTFALVRIKAGVPDPLNIQMDWHLWVLLGISTTSLIGTPMILSTKKTKEPAQAAVEKASLMVNEPAEAVNANREGTLYVNSSVGDACFTDMFQGDELGNTGHIDLAKVQMFYFTVIVVVALLVMVLNAVTKSPAELDHFPTLPDGLVAILGISNAGYLTSKGVDHTKTTG